MRACAGGKCIANAQSYRLVCKIFPNPVSHMHEKNLINVSSDLITILIIYMTICMMSPGTEETSLNYQQKKTNFAQPN